MKRHLALGLIVAEVLVAGYLTWAHGSHHTVACVSGGGGCATVASSSYAELFGVPLATLGVVGAVAALAIWFWGEGLRARVAGFGLAICGALFSAFLTYLELFQIDAICQWCVASALIWGALCLVEGLRLNECLAEEIG